MKRDWKGMGKFHEFAGPSNVDASVSVENAHDDTIHLSVFGILDSLAHGPELARRINKVPSSRTNQHVNGNPQLRASSFHQTDAGSNPAALQLAAQFDPIGACPFSGHRIIE